MYETYFNCSYDIILYKTSWFITFKFVGEIFTSKKNHQLYKKYYTNWCRLVTAKINIYIFESFMEKNLCFVIVLYICCWSIHITSWLAGSAFWEIHNSMSILTYKAKRSVYETQTQLFVQMHSALYCRYIYDFQLF